jgi:hypothetical protein
MADLKLTRLGLGLAFPWLLLRFWLCSALTSAYIAYCLRQSLNRQPDVFAWFSWQEPRIVKPEFVVIAVSSPPLQPVIYGKVTNDCGFFSRYRPYKRATIRIKLKML